ncbi:hypothetical protein D3C85_1510550 [compost metagenome]
MRAGRQHEPALTAHEQGVVEQLPQPRQRMADRRLAQLQPQCGARDMALGKQCLEHHEQIEVDSA